MILKIGAAFLLLLTIILLPGCATIFSGTQAKINVADGNPAHAQVYMNGNYLGETPFEVKIPKKSFGKNTQLEIRADGYKPVMITVEKRVNGGLIFLDIVGTSLIGMFIDFATGAIYSPSPKTVKYRLEKAEAK